MTLLGTRIFANVIKLRRVLIRTAVGPKPKGRWPHKEGEARQTHRERNVKTLPFSDPGSNQEMLRTFDQPLAVRKES